MTTGDLFLSGSLLASLTAIPLCFSGNEAMEKRARGLAVLSASAAIGAGGLLLGMLLMDRFDLAYVASYSSKELPTVYKISAFWAGQQGSFLLWLIFHGIAGWILDFLAGPPGKRTFSSALGVFQILSALLSILVLAKSPFVLQEIPVENGAGLNPLLQDPWMAVHPPVIFLGYALLAVPLAYSLGALLVDPRSREWLEPARKWCLVAWGFLGAGMFIGGYWAYKVLGWGGYWGWDPVENSSLVPWLLAAALLHLLKAAQGKAAILPVAHLASIFCYALVLYGTFLTRSGLLGDFSVHSFAGNSIGLMIGSVNALVLMGGLLLLTLRAKGFPKGNMYDGYDSREFDILLGMLLTVFVAGLVFVGMSMPLLTQFLGHPAAVDSSFYLRTTTPLAIGMMAVMALACQRFYGKGKALSGSLPPKVALLVGVFLPLLAGVREILPVVLSGVSLMAMAASFRGWRRGILSFGGMMAHSGLGIAFLAMVLSGSGGLTATQEFQAGESRQLLGHEILYQGQEFSEDGGSKAYVYVVDGREIRALTKLRSNGTDAAREPAIERSFLGDVYIAPSPPEQGGMEERFLELGEISLGEGIAYIFQELEILPDEENPMHKQVIAHIAVTDGEREEEVRPVILMTADGGSSTPVPVLDGEERIRLTGVSKDQERIRLEILPSAEKAARVPVTATVSTKPFLWALWLGCAMVVAGTLLAVKRG